MFVHSAIEKFVFRKGYPTPEKQSPKQSFDNVEMALALELHSDFKEYFTGYWSDVLEAKAPQGTCELLQVIDADDFSRLQENLIGHVMMKRRLKQRITLFFGLTNEDDFILSVLNDTGEVVLEQVGCEPTQVLAANLADFIGKLS